MNLGKATKISLSLKTNVVVGTKCNIIKNKSLSNFLFLYAQQIKYDIIQQCLENIIGKVEQK